MKKFIVTLLPIIICLLSFGQHIQYRDKSKPKPPPAEAAPIQQPVVTVPKPVVIKNVEPPKPVEQKKPDSTINTAISKTAKFKSEPVQARKQISELITGCKLSADPDKVAQLPLVINDVPLDMVAKLKERYKNRIYSITGLNMIDVRLKLKLKICDKDGGKFRIEYLDKDGKIVNDPTLDYYEF